MAWDIISIGDSSLDTFLMIDEDEARLIHGVKKNVCEICFDYGDKIPVKSVQESVGGNAANTAVGFSRLGLKTAIYSILGADDAGDRILKKLQQEKVGHKYVQKNGHTNHSTILSYEGERTIFSYHEKRDYGLPRLTPSSWFYITSMRDGYHSVFRSLSAYLQKNPAFIAYNPGTYQLHAGIAASQIILNKTTVLILNRQESASWLKRSAAEDIQTLLSELADKGPHAVVITDGPKGSYGFDGINFYHCPSTYVPTKESTGAGDAYASGLTAALFYGYPLKEAMIWGTLNSASVISKIGSQAGLLTKKEILHALDKTTTPLSVPILA